MMPQKRGDVSERKAELDLMESRLTPLELNNRIWKTLEGCTKTFEVVAFFASIFKDELTGDSSRPYLHKLYYAMDGIANGFYNKESWSHRIEILLHREIGTMRYFLQASLASFFARIVDLQMDGGVGWQNFRGLYHTGIGPIGVEIPFRPGRDKQLQMLDESRAQHVHCTDPAEPVFLITSRGFGTRLYHIAGPIPMPYRSPALGSADDYKNNR